MSETVSGKAGGVLTGKKHSEGGIEAVVDGSKKVELESEEVILSADSMKDPEVVTVVGTKKQIASKINSDKGHGVNFEEGAKMKRGAMFEKGGEVSVRNYTFVDFLPFLKWWND